MEKYKYDEGNGLWYELQGDYYIPCLKLSDENQVTIGIWGQRHLNAVASPCACFYSYFRLCRFKRYLNRIFVVWHL